MIGAAVAALQGQAAWGYLVWGLPAALVAASLWTQFMLLRTPAELHLRPSQAAVRSIHDVLYNRSPEWSTLHHVRSGPGFTDLSVGWQTYTCYPHRWRKYNALQDAAERAFRGEPMTVQG